MKSKWENPTIDRRSLIKGLLVTAAVVPVGMFVAGCPTFANIEASIKAWLPLASSSFNAILGLLATAGVICAGCAALSAAVFGAIDVATKAVDAYLSAPSSDKATLLGKLQTALTAIQGSLTAFFSAINIPIPGLATVVVGLAKILLSAIGGFLTKIQTPTAVPTTSQHRMNGQLHEVPPKVYKDTKDFVKDWNAIAVTNGYPQAQLR